jgi:hypothetical protein
MMPLSRTTEGNSMTRVQQAGDRIEELLGVLAGTGKGAVAEELVRLLVEIGRAHV